MIDLKTLVMILAAFCFLVSLFEYPDHAIWHPRIRTFGWFLMAVAFAIYFSGR